MTGPHQTEPTPPEPSRGRSSTLVDLTLVVLGLVLAAGAIIGGGQPAAARFVAFALGLALVGLGRRNEASETTAAGAYRPFDERERRRRGRAADGHRPAGAEHAHPQPRPTRRGPLGVHAGVAGPPAGARPVVDEGPATVLLVDPSPVLRRLTGRQLLNGGFLVLEAGTGHEAVDAFRQSGVVRLVLTEVVLPDMPGRELAERLCAIDPGLEVVYTSQEDDEVLVRHGVGFEGVRFLRKPISAQDIVETLRAALAAS